MQAPRACGCKRGERGGKLGGKKVFVKILGMGEWAPLFYPPFQPYPPLHIPQGVSRGTCLVWQVNDQGHDGRPQAQAGPQGRPPGIGIGYQYSRPDSYVFNILKRAYILSGSRALSFQGFQVI
jgi:hypothetical protein